MAITLHQVPYHAGDFAKDQSFEVLEQKYLQIVGKYNREQVAVMGQMMGITLQALQTPQDFLGEIYLEIGLQGDKLGQFFTPFAICQLLTQAILRTVLTGRGAEKPPIV